jgi:cytochrome P450
MNLVFYNLSRDPVRYKKLRDIIINNFGTYDDPRDITFEKLKECKYLRYVNDETLRLYPPVAINCREANKDTTLPRGGGKDGNSPLFIPKGMMCDYSVHVMHHRKDIWGPDAEEFKPERWEGKKVGWEFLPVRFLNTIYYITHIRPFTLLLFLFFVVNIISLTSK